MGFDKSELLTLAGYFTPTDGLPMTQNRVATYGGGHLDADIARFFAHEPVGVQRAVIGILNILKNLERAERQEKG